MNTDQSGYKVVIPNENTSSGYGVSTPEGRISSGLRPPSPPSGEGARPPLRLPPVTVKPREKMTARELSEAQQDHQAGIALECEVRAQARKLGLPEAVAVELGTASRAGFRIVNGEPIPVAGDRQTVVLSADGVNVMSVSEWVRKQARATSPQPSAQAGPATWSGEGEEEVLPMRNPFRRKTWNLTEQMRLQRRDPRLAKRLKADAYAAGEE